MAGFLDILTQVATIVGGTQPAASTNPYWFSGDTVGDGTGISGLKGCYSTPPNSIETVPVGIVLEHEFRTEYYMSRKMDADIVRLLIFVRNNDSRTQVANLHAYRDSVPAAFEQHMQLNASAAVWQVLVKHGRTGVFPWGGQDYLGWEFELTVDRDKVVNFTV